LISRKEKGGEASTLFVPNLTINLTYLSMADYLKIAGICGRNNKNNYAFYLRNFFDE